MVSQFKGFKMKHLKWVKNTMKYLTIKGFFRFIAYNSFLIYYPICLIFWLKHLDKTWVIIDFM